MKKDKLILASMIIVSWLTLPLLGRKTIKRFLPGAIFISLFVYFENKIALRNDWWKFHKKLHPKLGGMTPLLAGPFFVGSLWILKFIYGRFFLYFLTNLIVDSLFTYVIIDWFKKAGYATLLNLKKYQLSLLFLTKTVLMYLFQYVSESFSKSNEN
ncbi:hypothetical protein SM124_19340 [Bacillus sp. 31A1R]|uniref:Uncharacterized protein n=1 Tax=Robertmurraya mangrovi TaxID=3098077 RepID=A0ABU5J374_9BACI|nr:hypothetical protein [Bacillus sp. 31A1R]MDZ5473878.1 hypothetical protein [Bacillus sp. 31A1R]